MPPEVLIDYVWSCCDLDLLTSKPHQFTCAQLHRSCKFSEIVLTNFQYMITDAHMDTPMDSPKTECLQYCSNGGTGIKAALL